MLSIIRLTCFKSVQIMGKWALVLIGVRGPLPLTGCNVQVVDQDLTIAYATV